MGANNPDNFPVDTDTFTSDDWKERIAAFQPGGGDAFSLEQSEAILVGEIPWDVRFSFIRAVLGYATVDASAQRLNRELPLFHPWYDWMSAHSVHLQPKVPDKDNLKIEPLDPERSFPYAGYTTAEATIRFKQQPWKQLTDDEIYDAGVYKEYNRYCWDPERQSSLEILSAAGKLLIYAEAGPAPSPLGVDMKSEIGIPISKEQLNYKWMHVPKDYVLADGSGNEGYRALKITPRIGTVNDAAFLGFQAGTILLRGVQYERFLWPLRTVGDSAYGYNITFNFEIFDPPKGAVSSYYGHNLMPWKGDNKFYYATVTGTTGGAGDTPFLPSSDFTKLFEYVNA